MMITLLALSLAASSCPVADTHTAHARADQDACRPPARTVTLSEEFFLSAQSGGVERPSHPAYHYWSTRIVIINSGARTGLRSAGQAAAQSSAFARANANAQISVSVSANRSGGKH
jgi:hypothetical protein